MKGLELNVTKQNGMTLVEYRLGTADVYDDRVADKVAPLGNIVPFQYKDEDGKRSVISYVHKDNSEADIEEGRCTCNPERTFVCVRGRSCRCSDLLSCS